MKTIRCLILLLAIGCTQGDLPSFDSPHCRVNKLPDERNCKFKASFYECKNSESLEERTRKLYGISKLGCWIKEDETIDIPLLSIVKHNEDLHRASHECSKLVYSRDWRVFAVSNGSDCYSAKNPAKFFENLKYTNDCMGENVFHAFVLLDSHFGKSLSYLSCFPNRLYKKQSGPFLNKHFKEAKRPIIKCALTASLKNLSYIAVGYNVCYAYMGVGNDLIKEVKLKRANCSHPGRSELYQISPCYSSPCPTNMKCIHTKNEEYNCKRMPNCSYESDFGYCHEQRVCDSYACLTFKKTLNGSSTCTQEETVDGHPIASAICYSEFSNGTWHHGLQNITYANISLVIPKVFKAQKLSITAKSDLFVNAAIQLEIASASAESISVEQAVSIAETLRAMSSITKSHISVKESSMQRILNTVSKVFLSDTVYENTPAMQSAKASVRHTLNTLSERLKLSPNENETRIKTNGIIVQVSLMYLQNIEEGNTSLSLNGTDVVIGKELVNELNDTEAEVRIVSLDYSDSRLFPSEENVSEISSINMTINKEPVLNISEINISFRNQKIIPEYQPIPGKTSVYISKTECLNWDNTNGVWLRNGCKIDTSGTYPVCRCQALSSFSMLVSTKEVPGNVALSAVSEFGCWISIIGLSLTIVIYLSEKELRAKQSTTILLNICFCLMISYFIFLFGLQAIFNKHVCYGIAIALQTFLLCAWCWMCNNAWYIYISIVKLFMPSTRKLFFIYAACYIIPIIWVLLNFTSAVFGIDPYYPDDIFFESSYKARNMCWLTGLSLTIGFLLPVGILLLLSIVFFSLVIRSIRKRGKIKAHSTGKTMDVKYQLMVAICIISTTGLTWIFGYLMLVAEDVTYVLVMGWIFSVCNSMQGFLIFIMTCVSQRNVRVLWVKRIRKLLRSGKCMKYKKEGSRSWRPASSPRLNRTLRTEATVLHRPSLEIPKITFAQTAS